MPFRTKELLEIWVEKFRADRDDCDHVTVLIQDGTGGADTGLVYVPLKHASTDVMLQPAGSGDPRWVITFGRREEEFDLTAQRLYSLSAELAVAAELCDFLEAESVAYIQARN